MTMAPGPPKFDDATTSKVAAIIEDLLILHPQANPDVVISTILPRIGLLAAMVMGPRRMADEMIWSEWMMRTPLEAADHNIAIVPTLTDEAAATVTAAVRAAMARPSLLQMAMRYRIAVERIIRELPEVQGLLPVTAREP